MDKALADIPVGKEISSSSPPESWKKNSAKYTDYYKVPEKGWKGYDYSHVLKPELRDNGYSLNVYHNDAPRKDVIAVLKHKDKKIGHAVGHVVSGVMELGTEHATEIFDPMHTSKGLGVSMYEGVMAHAKNVLGAKKIRGGAHSTSASFVHRAISKKHDMDYEPDPNIYGDYGEKQAIGLKERGHDLSFLPEHKKAKELYDKIKQSPHDDRFAGYQYALKAESMKKALADIPVGNQISSSPPREHWSPLTTNNFAQMTGRSSKGWKGYDYSHVLKPELKDKGYTLTVHHDNPHENVGDKRFYKKALVATVKHKGKKIGNSVGYLHDNGSLELATEFASHINPLHRGKGLGVSMYEGIMSHSKNALNGKQVVGGVHSSMASRVHSALAKKHGLDYAPVAQENDKPTGEYDDKFGAYNYALKSETIVKRIQGIQNLLSKSSIEDTMHEFKEGTLHSGSKKGPKVTSKDQAIAIALNQKHAKSEHTWRNKPILKDKDIQDLDQTTTAYALKLGDTKKAEEKAYNEYQRNHRLDAAAHHYKALGMALAKCNQNAAAHHRLAYQGHMQALGLNGLESPPRVIMERIRQMVDNEQFRFKAHPADIF